ncbi:indoleamine 2,3-dioxygenase [Hypoxylon sp. NC1633]|nr:indoleamine 2,3-dioxygenase [Hypoxylon sp. NC1633]
MTGRTQSSLEHGGPLNQHSLLRIYSITENGFLPEREPLRRLIHPYYRPWEFILDDLPSLIRAKAIRRAVGRIHVLSVTELHTEEEWRRAYVVLSFLAHAYIWGDDTASEVLPPAISVPFLQVSQHLDLPPVATYAALNLWNFTCSSLDFRELDKVRALHTFSGTEDESWFFSVSVAMEAEGACVIPIMLQALQATQHGDYLTVSRALDKLVVCVGKLGALLDRMDEKCDPVVFYHQIRPYLAGSKNMSAAGLPNGVLYTDGDGTSSWKQLRGGSNGQSSLIQFLDVVLGIKHTSSGSVGPRSLAVTQETSEGPMSFHEEVRLYMPARHRAFLEHVSGLKSLAAFVNESGEADENRSLRRSFQAATKALGDFRNRHMQIVTRYIIVPSRNQAQASMINLATASLRTNRLGGELTGTGGTALIPFLKQTRDETYLTGIEKSKT